LITHHHHSSSCHYLSRSVLKSQYVYFAHYSVTYIDHLPFETTQSAGITFKKDGESAKHCLSFGDRPSTPPHIRKYRKSCFGPGQRRIHYGTYDDAKTFEKEREKLSKSQSTFGVSSAGSLHVDDVFSHGPQTSMHDTLNANLERHFKSRQHALGKGKSHGHKLPSHVSHSDFRFGKVDPKKSETAIKAIFPETRIENSKEDIERYKKSHAAFEPGEQLKREYNWNTIGVDPERFRFGKTEGTDGESTERCLKDSSHHQGTKLISKKTQDHRRTKDVLGKCRDLGLRDGDDKTRVFGVKSKILNEWGAAECIQGDYSEKDQMPDDDLGRSVRPGFRNINVTNRTFGCPTVRDDIPKPKTRSVADNQNYGTDATCHALLHPSRFNSVGVNDSDFAKLRTPYEIRDIFQKIGKVFDNRTFASLWYRACSVVGNTTFDRCSVVSFRKVVDDLEQVRDSTSRNPDWWYEASRWADERVESK